MKKKEPFDLLSMIDLKVLPSFAQQVIIASLIEEIRWLKKRVARLERQEDGEMLTSAVDPYCQKRGGTIIMKEHYTVPEIDYIRNLANHQIDLETREWSQPTDRFHVSSAQVRLILKAVRKFIAEKEEL